MIKKVKLKIDGKEIETEEGKNVINVAKEIGIDIPILCYDADKDQCLGTCRVCTIKWKRHYVAACVLKAEEGMDLTINNDELKDLRKALVELLFVEGNHFCPSCEKSGDCQLQTLGYKLCMTAPRFHYRFNNHKIDFNAKKILFEHNRCILCKKCSNQFKDDNGQQVFFFNGKGAHLKIAMDLDRVNKLSEERIDELIELCPVGALLKKGKGFDRPYGTRRYDNL
ncbi:MAG: 2Fe-2S iron-sulfur cluster-binding protein [Bdellovibrionota bacterium]